VAARLARGEEPPGKERPLDDGRHADWPDDLPEIVYIDNYGNALTGMRAAELPPDATLLVASGRRVPPARTFADAPRGAPLWYENSNGLAEIAVNLGRADRALALAIGSSVTVLAP
jgi:S-adenosylmethionine hydrolase